MPIRLLRGLGKALLIFIILLVVIIILTVGCVFVFKKDIIKATITELNQLLTTRVAISEDIDVTFWEHFPHISVRFHKVIIYENLKPANNLRLAEADQLSFTFDAIDLWNGNYTFDNVYISNGSVRVTIDSGGVKNYEVVRKDSLQKTATNFNLEKIVLENFKLIYNNSLLQQQYDITFHKGITKLALINNKYLIDVKSATTVNQLLVQGNDYFKEKDAQIDCNLSYDVVNEFIVISPSQLKVENAIFNFGGKIETKTKKVVQLTLQERQGSIQTLLSLLPTRYYQNLKDYESKGNIYFNATVSGVINKTTNPLLTVNFGFTDASIFHPGLKKLVNNASMKGTFTNGNQRKASSFKLELEDITFTMEGKTFTGNFAMINFEDPVIKTSVHGALDAEILHGFYPIPNIKKIGGNFSFNIRAAGRLKDLADPKTADKVKASGEIEFEKGYLFSEHYNFAIENLSGQILFNNNDLSVNHLMGKIGSSDFKLHGYLKNVISKLVYDKQALFIEADLHSNFLDLKELAAAFEKAPSAAHHNKISTSTRSGSQQDFYSGAYVLLDCNIDALKYDLITASKVKATVNFNNQRTSLTGVSLAVAGGAVNLEAYFNKIPNNNMEVHCYIKGNQCKVDSIFYMFRNFDQQFITNANLKGDLAGSCDAYFQVDPQYKMQLPTLKANIDASVFQGQLNHFEPMKKLSKFIKEERLENIYFSELSNKFYIENETLLIPEMEIHSSASNLTISGTHTFTHLMDYKVTVPLNNFKKVKKDKDEAYGAIEEDHQGNANLFLTIKGTSENYKIAYDKQRTTKKIKEDLKKEKEELRGIFKKKKVKEKVIEDQHEQEFFNFDD